MCKFRCRAGGECLRVSREAVGGLQEAAVRFPHILLRRSSCRAGRGRVVLEEPRVEDEHAPASLADYRRKVVASATTILTEVAENDTNRDRIIVCPVTQMTSGKSATSSPSEWDFYQPDDRTETDVKRATVEGLGDESCSHSY
ncbi:hypothetical protein FIBSPDRAFT_884006 [Athelia psychrophila]|uniref:Uncharacterized protein n=1 Tax=Athelia psychrophila TaxID=1759441 RepID=A0A166TC57_9AGAM|nr:hypothetical protein FIBSPDRAFT_884006 [Fibularhizoctonia sp. CBS 109695]